MSGANDTDVDESLIEMISGDVEDTLTTDPREWSQQQIIGVAVGAAVAVILLFFLCCWCRRRKGGRCCGGGGKSKQQAYQLQRPYVTRKAAGSSVSSSNLPRGVILTGAEKLRRAKLDGAGVRVGVIDSGIDKDHPGFDGMVVKQEWYRSGTPVRVISDIWCVD